MSDKHALSRRRYSVSKRLVKLTKFHSFPLHVPRYQGLPPISFVLSYQLLFIDWVLVRARSVEGCISVERLKNILKTDLHSILQKINKFAAGQTGPILTNTSSSRSHKFCREFCGIC